MQRQSDAATQRRSDGATQRRRAVVAGWGCLAEFRWLFEGLQSLLAVALERWSWGRAEGPPLFLTAPGVAVALISGFDLRIRFLRRAEEYSRAWIGN